MRVPDLKSAERKRLETRRQRDRDLRDWAQPELRKCEAKDEDTCRALYCPKHRQRLAYCPWEKNGHVTPPGESGCRVPKHLIQGGTA